MANKHYNHIHPQSAESYGHMHKKGGDHHLSASPGRDQTQGPMAAPGGPGGMM